MSDRRLSADDASSIRADLAAGLSLRAIGRKMGVDHKTVKRHLELDETPRAPSDEPSDMGTKLPSPGERKRLVALAEAQERMLTGKPALRADVHVKVADSYRRTLQRITAIDAAEQASQNRFARGDDVIGARADAVRTKLARLDEQKRAEEAARLAALPPSERAAVERFLAMSVPYAMPNYTEEGADVAAAR